MQVKSPLLPLKQETQRPIRKGRVFLTYVYKPQESQKGREIEGCAVNGGHLIMREHRFPNCEKRAWHQKRSANKDVPGTLSCPSTETAHFSLFLHRHQKQNRARVRREKKPLCGDSSVLSEPSSPASSSLGPSCADSFLNQSITKSETLRPSLTGFPPGWGCGIRGSGSLPGNGLHCHSKDGICAWSWWTKTPSHVSMWTHTEKNKQMFLLSNRQAYTSSGPRSSIQQQLVFTAEVLISKVFRKRKEMDYRPPQKAVAGPTSASSCCCPSAPCDPHGRSDTQNWFSPFSGLCFPGPGNINFHQLLWRSTTQGRFNCNRQ